MSKKSGESDLFFRVLMFLLMSVVALAIAAVVTLFVLLAADLIYYEPPSWVAANHKWRWRTREFWQRVNWIFAGAVFVIVFFGYWVSLYSRELKKWLREKGII